MMLSTISHSSMPSSFSTSREHIASPTMTASLAILPQRQNPLPQRPKLQINTQQVRTFGKGSSLRLETLSAVSPTDRNTFSNTYEAPASAAPALGHPSRPKLSISANLPHPSAPGDHSSTSTPNSASTPSSTLTSATSTDSVTISIPYKQPHNLKSVLANSPARHLLPRKMAPARPLFSVSKRVSFRTPLEEEIKTVKYTLAHSDIESSTGSLSSLASSSSDSSSLSSSTLSLLSSATDLNRSTSPSISSPTEQSTTTSAFSSLEGSPGLRSPRTGEKRDSSSSDESDSDEDACPETPVAGRRKRRREWRWTLGPLDKSSSSSTGETSTSDESN